MLEGIQFAAQPWRSEFETGPNFLFTGEVCAGYNYTAMSPREETPPHLSAVIM